MMMRLELDEKTKKNRILDEMKIQMEIGMNVGVEIED
jgi:hypothetical protein